ncbi:MAG TPA: hypothetical protein VFH14_14410 [Gemmatimonadaceae bacterium]|nr:hypothetical protein [Gemmatimonadaceae bacterium]
MPVRYRRPPATLVGLVILVLGCDGTPTNLRSINVGAIEATMVTTGAEPDPDGYRLVVDDAFDLPVSTNGSVVIRDLEAGVHALRLEDLASNCQIAGANPRTVTVPRARAAAVAFNVTCVQFTGSIRVTTTTTGAETDPDGYAVVVDQDDYYPREGDPIATNGSVTFTRVHGGEHSVSLEDVARNCTVAGSNPRAVAVSPGIESHAAFAVECQQPGALRVIAATSGTDFDLNGYSVAIGTARFDTAAALPVNDTVTVALPPGDFTVVLGGLTTNCQVTGTHGRTGIVPSVDTVEVTFDVACTAADQLAYVNDSDGNAEIYVIKVNGADRTRRTTNAANDGGPAWSPDASRIAFRTDRDGNGEIYVMNADGSNPVRLTNNPEDDASPTWSPDGTRIAFASHRGGNTDIYAMNADGTNLVRLTSSDGPDSDPAWSPDGAKIAFMSYQSGSYDIYVMNANGLGLTALTSGDDDDWSPAWSPDGAKIAFSRGCYYYCEYDLFVVNVDGSGVTRFPLPSCDEADPAWSPDGQRIAFTSRRSYYGSGCPTSVMVMRADGTNVTLVTNGNASAPSWRP